MPKYKDRSRIKGYGEWNDSEQARLRLSTSEDVVRHWLGLIQNFEYLVLMQVHSLPNGLRKTFLVCMALIRILSAKPEKKIGSLVLSVRS